MRFGLVHLAFATGLLVALAGAWLPHADPRGVGEPHTLALAADGSFGTEAKPVELAGESASPSQDGTRVEPDVFHPDHQPDAKGARPPLPKPAYGGRVVLQLERLPPSLNNVLENQGALRRMMYELHETLLQRNWETRALEPSLAREWWVEDALHLKHGVASDGTWTLRRESEDLVRGKASRDGDDWVLETRLATGQTVQSRYSKDVVLRVERGTVVTLLLRDDVRWHDGHPFGARDVVFSIDLFKNPLVDCGERRNAFAKVVSAQVLGDAEAAPGKQSGVRVWFDQQYYYALATLGTELTILPSHLYDLDDPDNELRKARLERDPSWKPDDKERAEAINKNVHNRDWIGVGPYRLARFDSDGVLAERFDGYYDRANAGYVDSIFWRSVPNDAAAFQALINGELDFFGRVTSDDYFGAATEAEAFRARCYKGYYYSDNYWYVGWNLRRPKLADVRVRQALAHALDAEAFKRSFYRGLAERVTGPWVMTKPEYDKSIQPLSFDPDASRKLLAQAGWIDRDADGVVEKDGVPLEIELLSDSGNSVAKAFAVRLQEDFARVGVRLRFTPLDAKAVDERKKARDFDALALGWVLGYETDPEQVWHSKWAPAELKGSNFGGFADTEVDELIEQGQREIDDDARAAIWRRLHARIHELQPYLFGWNPPRKFGLKKSIRNVQLVPIDPNVVLRRWYYPEGTPGTRATLERPAAPPSPPSDREPR